MPETWMASVGLWGLSKINTEMNVLTSGAGLGCSSWLRGQRSEPQGLSHELRAKPCPLTDQCLTVWIWFKQKYRLWKPRFNLIYSDRTCSLWAASSAVCIFFWITKTNYLHMQYKVSFLTHTCQFTVFSCHSFGSVVDLVILFGFQEQRKTQKRYYIF